VHAAVQGVSRFVIDLSLPDHAAKSRLDMAGGAAEPIVNFEVAEGGIKVVSPK
jgi:hypothetical protein